MYIFNETISTAIVKYVTKGCNKQRNNGHSYPMFIKCVLNKEISLWHKRFLPAGRVAYKQQTNKCNKLLHKLYAHLESRLIHNESQKVFFKYVNKKITGS